MKSQIDDRVQILIGTWMAGNELQHLKNLQPGDITANADAKVIIGTIKSVYYDGIAKGRTVGNRQKRKLLDELSKKGYDEVEVCGYADKAKDAHTAYMQVIAKVYSLRCKHLLKTVDLEKHDAEEQIKSILDTYRIENVQTLKTPSTDIIREIVHDVEHPDDVKVIPLGLSDLTRLTGGLREGELTAIGARPSTGKTAFALQMAIKIADTGKFKVMFDEIEMSDKPIGKRMIAHETNATITKGMIDAIEPMTPEQKQEFLRGAGIAHNRLNGENFVLLRGEKNLESIEQQLALHHPDVLIIDQLTQLDDDRFTFENKRVRYNHLTGSLKALALKTGVSIVLLCQLNRSGEGVERPYNGMFKDSGSIEEDADRCIILNPVEPDEDWHGKGDPVDIWVTKNREGEANFCVHTDFIKSRQRYIPQDMIL